MKKANPEKLLTKRRKATCSTTNGLYIYTGKQ